MALTQDPEQRLWEAERRERALHGRLARLEEQNRQLLGQLVESQSQEDSTARKEREVMLRLKEVVDKQRDELRAQAHEIVCKSRDTEAVSVRELAGVEGAPLPAEEPQHQDAGRSPAHCCFSKEELQQILQERNELKTNLFLVQEELAYYQRELLNEERDPSLFLDPWERRRGWALCCNSRLPVTSRRWPDRTPLVPAWMWRKGGEVVALGLLDEAGCDEDDGSWLPARGADCVDAQPPESRIRSL
nr:PREDICTED: rab-interacting lysosomal protein [Opisthocomus hoazin]